MALSSTTLNEYYFDDCNIFKEFQTHPTGSVIKAIRGREATKVEFLSYEPLLASFLCCNNSGFYSVGVGTVEIKCV